MPRLTKKFVDRLPPNPEKDFCVWDDDIAGFGVRLNPGGKKTYIFQYRNKLRKERKYKIGIHGIVTTEEAREIAIDLRRQVKREGIDPAENKKIKCQEDLNTPNIRKLTEEYFYSYAEPNKRPRSVIEDKALARLYILPHFGHVLVKELTSKQVEDWKRSMQHKPYRSNRTLALLSKMYSLAVRWKWADNNPIKGIEKYQEHKRERWLQDEELSQLWEALGGHGHYAPAHLIKMLLLTGSRLGETMSATWEQFDLERGVWIKPSHATKQKKVEHVPLALEAINFLKELKELSQGKYLFSGRFPDKPLVNIYAFWEQVLKEAEIENLRIHDLRHTYASHLVSSGLSLSIVGKLLGHTQAATTQRYAHLADQALRDATNVFGNKIANLKKNEIQGLLHQAMGMMIIRGWAYWCCGMRRAFCLISINMGALRWGKFLGTSFTLL